MGKDAGILGMSLWNIGDEDLRLIHAELGKGFSGGTLTPVVGRELPLADAARAHALVLEPGATGKIVLIP
jgi:NADPH2:quinone reductase